MSPKNQAFRSISFARFARSLFSLEKAKTTLFAFSPYAKAHAGKVNAARVLWCAPKRRAAEENSVRRAANKRRTQGFSQNHDFLFHQLETKSVNLLPQRGKTPSAAGVWRLSLQSQANRSISFAKFARSFYFILREAKPRFCLSAPDLP